MAALQPQTEELGLFTERLSGVLHSVARLQMGSQNRKEVAKVAQRVRHLRNRVAHHESLAFGITQTGQRMDGLRVKQRPAGAFRDICTLEAS